MVLRGKQAMSGSLRNSGSGARLRIRPFQKKKNTHTIMTDSGKYIHYGPALTGRQLAFGSLEMCIDAACTGKSTSEPPAWLLEARVYLVIHGR